MRTFSGHEVVPDTQKEVKCPVCAKKVFINLLMKAKENTKNEDFKPLYIEGKYIAVNLLLALVLCVLGRQYCSPSNENKTKLIPQMPQIGRGERRRNNARYSFTSAFR